MTASRSERIRVDRSGGALHLVIGPPRTVWDWLTATISLPMLAASWIISAYLAWLMLTTSENGVVIPIVLTLGILGYLSFTLIFVYANFRDLFGHEEVMLDDRVVTITTHLFSIRYSRSRPLSAVTSTRLVVRRSRRFVARSIVFDSGDKPIRTTSALQQDEATYILALIQSEIESKKHSPPGPAL